MVQKDKAVSYKALHEELEEILAQLQQDDVDIDDAIKLYARGQTVITQLQTYLQTAENKITELQVPAKD